MTAKIIDGKAIAAEVRAEVAGRAKALSDWGCSPGSRRSSWAITRPRRSTSA
jgi:hypothetical protein